MSPDPLLAGGGWARDYRGEAMSCDTGTKLLWGRGDPTNVIAIKLFWGQGDPANAITPNLRRASLFRSGGSLVPRHPIFRARPAALSKNRVWTRSLRKLGHVYIWRSVNWSNCIGVNYIISYQERSLCRQNICKLAICDDAKRNLLYLSNLIGATTCQYARMIKPQFYQ